MAWVKIECDDGSGVEVEVPGTVADLKSDITRAINNARPNFTILAGDGAVIIEAARVTFVGYAKRREGPYR